MLRLCDTLLGSYGTSRQITSLLDRTRIYINPLSNPDGTYYGGDSTVALARRYNADSVDLNRNYPDPFGTPPLDSLQPENKAMIAYVERHNFLLSANLHGGSEVMNYPWDSFTSYERLNEHSEWWQAVSKRFVDTCRRVDNRRFRDVRPAGYVNGGDWYVISNGRQDYFNVVYTYPECFVAAEAAWFSCDYPFQAGYRFQFQNAVMEYKAHVLTIHHANGEKEVLDAEAPVSVRGVALNSTDAYYNELRYFTDCVLDQKPCDLVRPEELEAVLDIIDEINRS